MDSLAPLRSGKIFEEIAVMDDPAPRPAEIQMAVDEALLETTKLPVLRFYRWESPCVTIGYFESYAGATAAHPGLPVIRRWTGGGVVVHGEDAPYSLIVPSREPFAAVRPATAYRVIHGALAGALHGQFPEITLATGDAPKQGAACFENPVTADLLCGGLKVGGAGQRRTRLGLLHQGSVQLGENPFQDVRVFAERLAVRIWETNVPHELLTVAERLAEARYRSPGWKQDRKRR
jgi:lipoate-protein ligase A